jgi:hypothetical protein
MDDAALAQLLDTYNNQNSNLGHDIEQQAPKPEGLSSSNNIDHGGAQGHQYTKAE